MSKVSNEMERWSTVVENDGFEEGGHQGRIEIDYVSSGCIISEREETEHVSSSGNAMTSYILLSIWRFRSPLSSSY